jgi:IS30 family transposase
MTLTCKSYTQIQPAERVTLASLHSVRSMAATLEHSPSNISRELRRNSQQGQHESGAAHRRCQTRRRNARHPGKLHPITVRSMSSVMSAVGAGHPRKST